MCAEDFLPVLGNFSLQTVSSALERQILQGRTLEPCHLAREPRVREQVAILSQDGQLLALVEYPTCQANIKSYRYLAVFNKLDD